MLWGAHSQVYPEGGSKEIKEESCHHSRQALTATAYYIGWKCFCAISNSSLSRTALLSWCQLCHCHTCHVIPKSVTEVALTPSPLPSGSSTDLYISWEGLHKGGGGQVVYSPHSPRTSGSLESCSYPESACFSPGSQLLVVLGEGVCEGEWVESARVQV